MSLIRSLPAEYDSLHSALVADGVASLTEGRRA